MNKNVDRNILLTAVAQQKLKLLRILLEGGTDINYQSYDGKTALIIACCFVRDNDDGEKRYMVIELLLQYGANPNLRDLQGRTALMYALRHILAPSIIKVLLDNGADPYIRDNYGRNAFDFIKSRFWPRYRMCLRQFTESNKKCAKTVDTKLPVVVVCSGDTDCKDKIKFGGNAKEAYCGYFQLQDVSQLKKERNDDFKMKRRYSEDITQKRKSKICDIPERSNSYSDGENNELYTINSVNIASNRYLSPHLRDQESDSVHTNFLNPTTMDSETGTKRVFRSHSLKGTLIPEIPNDKSSRRLSVPEYSINCIVPNNVESSSKFEKSVRSLDLSTPQLYYPDTDSLCNLVLDSPEIEDKSYGMRAIPLYASEETFIQGISNDDSRRLSVLDHAINQSVHNSEESSLETVKSVSQEEVSTKGLPNVAKEHVNRSIHAISDVDRNILKKGIAKRFAKLPPIK